VNYVKGKGGDNSGWVLFWLYPHVCRDTAEVQCIRGNGLSKE